MYEWPFMSGSRAHARAALLMLVAIAEGKWPGLRTL